MSCCLEPFPVIPDYVVQNQGSPPLKMPFPQSILAGAVLGLQSKAFDSEIPAR
jgi:hypothetical protein